MRDFYKQHTPRLFEPLRRNLPDYVNFRNYVRGHRALGGKPSITRLNEKHFPAASSEVLDRLKSFASYEIGRRILSASGSFRLFNRDAPVDTALARQEVIFFETLEGLEARADGQSAPFFGITEPTGKRLSDSTVNMDSRQFCFFGPLPPAGCPRIAVANQP